MTEFQEQLDFLGACQRGRRHVGLRSAREFWEGERERPDYMIWLAEVLGADDVAMRLALARSVSHVATHVDMIPEVHARVKRACAAVLFPRCGQDTAALVCELRAMYRSDLFESGSTDGELVLAAEATLTSDRYQYWEAFEWLRDFTDNVTGGRLAPVLCEFIREVVPFAVIEQGLADGDAEGYDAVAEENEAARVHRGEA